jgi:hypothetical protein
MHYEVKVLLNELKCSYIVYFVWDWFMDISFIGFYFVSNFLGIVTDEWLLNQEGVPLVRYLVPIMIHNKIQTIKLKMVT